MVYLSKRQYNVNKTSTRRKKHEIKRANTKKKFASIYPKGCVLLTRAANKKVKGGAYLALLQKCDTLKSATPPLRPIRPPFRTPLLPPRIDDRLLNVLGGRPRRSLGGVRRQHPVGCCLYCQLEDDGGGVRGFSGFAEITRLTNGCTRRARARARSAALWMTLPRVG